MRMLAMMFLPDPTNTGLYSHEKRLMAGKFGSRQQMNCSFLLVNTHCLHFSPTSSSPELLGSQGELIV